MTTRRVVSAVTILLLLGAVGARFCAAQTIGPDYVISPGDALDVQVYGETDLSKTYAVGPAGSIVVPLMGQVTLAGLTLEQAQALLTQKLHAFLRFPHVTIGLSELQSGRKLYVLGYVTAQGPVALPFDSTVLDALAAAGANDSSDLRHVQITHQGQAPITLDLSGLRTGQTVRASEKVEYGDVIYVPRLDDRIAVLGQVKTPGSVLLPLGSKVTVLDALARIGGGLTNDASLTPALLVHDNGTSEALDLAALLNHGDTRENVTLHAGDALVVQLAENISVVGEVNKPLSWRSSEPVTVLEALAQAGSFTPKADLAHAQIVSSQGQARPVDLKALWEQGDQTQNLKLAAGDVLVLPELPPTNLLVVGAVQHQGVLELAKAKQRDLLRLVTAAGTLPESDLSRVAVYRGDQRFTVDLDAVMHGALDKNMALEPNDVVFVPEKSVIYVFGAVGRQGKLPWDPKLAVLDAISDAGGLAPRANEGAIKIIRTGADGKTIAIPVPFQHLKNGQNVPNIKLLPGDIVYVASLGERGALWNELQTVLWSVGAVLALPHL
jgi:polysaccharide export outer membrane protein